MRENFSFFGRLSSCPWPRLLFQLWQKKNSGYLEIRREGSSSPFWLSQGNLLILANFLPPSFLLSFPLIKNRFELTELELALNEAKEKGIPIIRFLIESKGFKPQEALNWVISAWKEWFFSFFELSDGEYSFEPLTPDDSLVYAEFFTPELILEGIRKMKNLSLIEAHLPGQNESLQVAASAQLGMLPLTETEKYILRLISTGAPLAEIYNRCHLGRKECQRSLFAFICLEIVSPSSNFSSLKQLETPSWKQLEKILASFNEKCAYIFRFVSKEIGPVAFNVLEKSLEEVRPYLSPALAEITLKEDGRVDFPAADRLAWQFLQKNFRQALLRDLNEILMAEILAVKKTLGSAIESALVQSLEKIGEG